MADNTRLMAALNSISPADLEYTEWIEVGMALKEEGLPCSIWDDWSKNDERYRPGDCERKWRTFNGGYTESVGGGTIVQMAKERGWSSGRASSNVTFGWHDSIQYDGDDIDVPAPDWDPVRDLTTYLETLFQPEDHVCYITTDVWQKDNGKWEPGSGVNSRTAGQLLESLRKHPGDIAQTIGDWKEEAGAWIRINPTDGVGVADKNITDFRYALVESDNVPVNQQDTLYRKLNLPIAALVHSGGKSLHAIVHIDAADIKEYHERVNFLFEELNKNGLTVDRQNKNPSRMSRMPGITRNGQRQYLVATNIGAASWSAWVAHNEDAPATLQDLPAMVPVSFYAANPPKLADELIYGVLRKGHKMLFSAPSKAGKSYAMMELCMAIATGGLWFDALKCRKGRVLYVNLEIDEASAANRFLDICKAQGIRSNNSALENILTMNLRGRAVPLDKLAPQLIRSVEGANLDAIIIDPIYKIITGDENNASEMGEFCNNFDRICRETGCSVIYVHHHSKGAQGQKTAQDRASGSGVFARDPDAQLDMIELVLTEDIKNNYRDGKATAWRIESNLREFPNIDPIDVWYECPIHWLDTSGKLSGLGGRGSQAAKNVNLESSGKRQGTPETKEQELINVFENLTSFSGNDFVLAQDMINYLGISKETFYRRIKISNHLQCEKGIVSVRKEECQ